MSPVIEGLGALLDPIVLLLIALGALLGLLVGAFPGVTGTMAIALASGFTLTLEPIQGLAVLLTIYVSANFGDRVPSILVNAPGTPASISTTFDGYPLAQQGKAGIALTASAFASAAGVLSSLLLLIFLAIPLSRLALEFGPREMFALVIFGLTMMVGVSGKNVLKGLISGLAGLALGSVGRDMLTGDPRFTFDVLELSSGVPFIAAIIGLFGIAEVFEQMMTQSKLNQRKPIADFGRWWPNKHEVREMVKPTTVGIGIGGVVGAVPAVGGDIAGILGWDQARRLSKRPERFGKGSLEGLTAGDTSSAATLGGSVTTTLSLGVPGDSVMAVMIGSMIIWGIEPGPSLFTRDPSLVYTIAGIMALAAVLALGLSVVRMRGVVKLLDLPRPILWAVILIFCMVGTFAVQNSVFDVGIMLVFGVVGLVAKRFGFPPGPMVLGLILGPLAESNFRRSMLIGSPLEIFMSPIALVLFALSAIALIAPFVQPRLQSIMRKRREGRQAITGVFDVEQYGDIPAATGPRAPRGTHANKATSSTADSPAEEQ